MIGNDAIRVTEDEKSLRSTWFERQLYFKENIFETDMYKIYILYSINIFLQVPGNDSCHKN